MPDLHRRLPLAAVAVLLPLLIALAPSGSSGDPAGCAPPPYQLAPKGGRAARFTMLIRVNKPRNVDDYARLQETHGQLRARDVFVVNTRWKGSSPVLQEEILSRLRDSFPCNRVIALNGLGADPQRPGYALSLAGAAQPWAVLLDWERTDWTRARATKHHMPRWKQGFGRSIHRLGSWVGRVAHGLTASETGAQRVGAALGFFGDWHYARIAGCSTDATVASGTAAVASRWWERRRRA